MTMNLRKVFSALALFTTMLATAAPVFRNERPNSIYLDSKAEHQGAFVWKMLKASDAKATAEAMSTPGFATGSWMDAVVPGTVLRSLVYNKVYPDPYYGDNNKIGNNRIPDISKVGAEFYTYWFRTEFDVPESFKGKNVWLQPDGINYRADIWVNGNLVSTMAGMFRNDYVDVTDFVKVGQKNAIAVLVRPVDVPGTSKPKSWGAVGEFRNGGNGNIGWNVTQLMTVGWDFTYSDGIRDRNTGIWRGISLYATGKVALRHPFVKSTLKDNYKTAYENISVELHNPTNGSAKCEVVGEIEGEGITFAKKFNLFRGERLTCDFTPREFSQLIIRNPKLWWPVNKGAHPLYTLKFKVLVDGKVSDSLSTRFGIREITTSRNTPDKSKLFYINGKPLFVRGTNWLPEAMLRTSDSRMDAELRMTAQCGVNLLRLWGGGIAESDRFYELCDELGLLVWQEFWLTGDTRHPHDQGLYLLNVESTIKRIRNHASLAFYVSSNESSEVSGAHDLITRLDGTRPYQMQSECDGVHDGSPYKQVNPMRHYENTASDRGSRIDGFNPEYGAPTLPVYESLREMMPAKDLWPINKDVWDYMDGGGFHLMTTLYTDMVNQYGKPATIEDYCKKAQLVGAMNSKSIWECWNENKLNYGDRFCSGLLFWYHNCANQQVCARQWDWTLEPTASLYHTMHSLEPIHAQFDYLKNTVSVANDTYETLKGYRLTATLYNLDSRKVATQTANVDVPEDGVANDVLKLSFPDELTQVHFIHLLLTDAKGRVVSDNFYWRSKDAYKGKNTLTGPCTSGFESLQNMPAAVVKTTVKTTRKDGKTLLRVTLRNTGKQIAFFNQVHLLDAQGSPVRPTFYTDNFFTLLPGASKTVEIETASEAAATAQLKVSGWNTNTNNIKLK